MIIINPTIIKKIEELIVKKNIKPNQILNVEKCKKIEYYLNEIGFRIIFYDKKLIIDYYESKPPHFRPLLFDVLQSLIKYIPIINDLDLGKDIKENSWISILWTPIKSTKSKFIQYSFLSYYNLNLFINNKNITTSFQNTLIGVLTLRLDDEVWFMDFLTKDKNLSTSYKLFAKSLSVNRI